ncbi:hypothetical protein A0H81_02369 [Grifola frondosa]|uniref:Uncharacterized protein n=1 Tax=Grifola frondosa TaxID=5627 RepID=A0A1C7MP01_GRIFR|nr:hypothetical protein A0H81_02369 [Grifola frondosa]
MLSFGLKIAWFTLSLTGLLSNLVALPAFVESLDSCWIPIVYTVANTVLQGVFCLGIIWKMNPFSMPRTFCIVQPILLALSWSVLTGLCSCMTFATSLAMLRPLGIGTAYAAYVRSRLRWHPYLLFIVAGYPLAALAAFVVILIKFNAAQPSDGMQCDVQDPAWIRLLSYSGIPLIFAIPCLLLSCAAALQFYRQKPLHRHCLVPTLDDNLTTFPLRRQSKSNNKYHSWRIPKKASTSSQGHTMRSYDRRSTTPSATLTVEAIPSPPSSFSRSYTRFSGGRAPISPALTSPKIRWREFNFPDSLSSHIRPCPRYSEVQSGPVVVPMFASIAERTAAATAAPSSNDEKEGSRQDDAFTGSRLGYIETEDDTVSGSLRWARDSEDSSSIIKSELEFARMGDRDADDFRPPVRVSPLHLRPRIRGATIRDAASAHHDLAHPVLRGVRVRDPDPRHDLVACRHVWAAQPPAPFGTQHVALLLAAWGPFVAFGVAPWRRKLTDTGGVRGRIPCISTLS